MISKNNLNFWNFRHIYNKQKNMTKFERAEKAERDNMIALFKQFNVQHYEFTEANTFDNIDGYFTGSTGNKVAFEVKNRKTKSDQYPTTIIESFKLDAIHASTNQTEYEPMLFVFFADNKVFFEKLKTGGYETFVCPTQATTMGNTELINKEFVKIPIDNKNVISLK
ncbi:hypothetical protein IW18_20360 [Flavobacterium hibernum]|uniref:Protein NO VEIN C-terminal domain-containing protein n=2 Tax=Flavobacterium hibernum TaxID=37752 RepID=A0A0D0EJC8_9FLAO|nr:hypothetical protein [Flavobacterium hibernum]KIO50945.1 hypothetical protein IW18_20360 [Flavobacterium hibernum]OXA85185.1 hypothetical protein B0A73_17700 [Flavobacterium hibernum]STO19562.1 Uncharacterised protein [Flavobacterium hibernum]